MDEKGLPELSSYEKLQKEKDDANMRYVAQMMHEMYYDDELENLDGIGNIDIEVPQELHDKMLAFARELDRKDAQERRRKLAYTVMKRCAVFLLCFGIVGGAAVSQSDALKARFTNLFLQEEEDHVIISPTDLSQLEEWDGYYFLENVPEGYELAYAEEDVLGRKIGFSNGKGLLILSQHSANAVLYADNETATYEKVTVRGHEGYYFEDKENETKYLYWIEGSEPLDLYIQNDTLINREKLLAIAEDIIFVQG